MSGNDNDRPGGGIRVGDQEREEAVRRLGEHYEAGRLTADEHTERVGEALKAKTHADLAALFTDLPGGAGQTGGEQQAGDTPQGAGMPWGLGAPWTAPRDRSGGRGQGSWGGPPWARGRRGFRGIPLPVLLVLGALALLGSIACTVAGGHPPVLLFVLLAVATVAFVRRRTQGRQA